MSPYRTARHSLPPNFIKIHLAQLLYASQQFFSLLEMYLLHLRLFILVSKLIKDLGRHIGLH
jgi:hypothetical protein